MAARKLTKRGEAAHAIILKWMRETNRGVDYGRSLIGKFPRLTASDVSIIWHSLAA